MDESLKAGLFLAALLARLGGGTVAGLLARKRLRGGKQIVSSDIPKLVEAVGAPPIPAVSMNKLKNAYYSKDPQLVGKHLLRMSDADIANATKHGVIAYDPLYKSEAVMAHEAGHGSISNRPWSSLSKINQDVLRPVLGMGSALAGWKVSSALAKKYGGMSPQAIGAGLGTIALGNIPALVSEYQASNLGMKGLAKLYDKAGHSDRIRISRTGRNRKALGAAFGTYATGATLDGLLMAALLNTYPGND